MGERDGCRKGHKLRNTTKRDESEEAIVKQ